MFKKEKKTKIRNEYQNRKDAKSDQKKSSYFACVQIEKEENDTFANPTQINLWTSKNNLLISCIDRSVRSSNNNHGFQSIMPNKSS